MKLSDFLTWIFILHYIKWHETNLNEINERGKMDVLKINDDDDDDDDDESLNI